MKYTIPDEHIKKELEILNAIGTLHPTKQPPRTLEQIAQATPILYPASHEGVFAKIRLVELGDYLICYQALKYHSPRQIHVIFKRTAEGLYQEVEFFNQAKQWAFINGFVARAEYRLIPETVK